MNDDPFAAFQASQPTAETKPEKTKRERKEKRGRKSKPAPVETPAGNGVMVPISALAAIRHLTDDEIKFTVSMAAGINELPRKAQQHVVAALARIFS